MFVNSFVGWFGLAVEKQKVFFCRQMECNRVYIGVEINNILKLKTFTKMSPRGYSDTLWL